MGVMKRLIPILAALVFALSMAVTAFADGNVHYSGNAQQFIFAPGSEHSPTDLFTEFKDVMPGDSLTQKILITNDISNKVKIKIYMRSLGAHQDSVEFLSQMNLRVEQLTDTILFDAPADQTAQLTEWTYLGTVYSGGEVELNVILDVPTSLDNSNKNLIGYLDWEFMVEELAVDGTDPTPPQTGDDTPLGLYIGLVAGSGMMILLLLVCKKKKQTV